MKKCKRCHVTKPLTEFNRDCHTKDKLSNKCRHCINQPNEREKREKELFMLRNSFAMGRL